MRWLLMQPNTILLLTTRLQPHWEQLVPSFISHHVQQLHRAAIPRLPTLPRPKVADRQQIHVQYVIASEQWNALHHKDGCWLAGLWVPPHFPGVRYKEASNIIGIRKLHHHHSLVSAFHYIFLSSSSQPWSQTWNFVDNIFIETRDISFSSKTQYGFYKLVIVDQHLHEKPILYITNWYSWTSLSSTRN